MSSPTVKPTATWAWIILGIILAIGLLLILIGLAFAVYNRHDHITASKTISMFEKTYGTKTR